MVFNLKHLFFHSLVIMAVGFGEEYYFPLSSDLPITFKAHHWKHPESNSSLDLNGIEIDIFRWQAAVKNKESVNVELINPVWEYAGLTFGNLSLPESINISKILNFRGTPTIYIQITPWRVQGNIVEVLTDGDIKIVLEPINFPVTFNHRYMLNGEQDPLQRTDSDAAEYVIICPSHFESAAQTIANAHNSFITDIVFTEDIPSNVPGDITGTEIRNYLINRIGDVIVHDGFLLLLGDEIYIPPIFNSSPSYPSDDFYTTEEPDCCRPQLYTGRIPVSTVEDAITVAKKIHDYIIYPTPGIWRSKVALVADDLYSSCSIDADAGQAGHVENSQEVYGLLKTLLPVVPYYGIHYNLNNCSYPDLTQDLIQSINNGLSLINYIGHGNPETWASEKLIDKSRDLPLIHPSDNKLAIWVAGTCSFGNYHGVNSFMEDLIRKEDGAIAVIASTEAVSHNDNYHFIKNLFNEISDYIDDPDNTIQSHIGKIVWNAKNGERKFHIFGDPALPLPFPKKTIQNLVTNPHEGDTIHLVQEENLLFNVSSLHASIIIRKNEEKHIFYFDSNSSGFSILDSLEYTVPGETYVQMDVSGSSTCFRIPIDAGACDSCLVIQAYQSNTGWDGKIETLQNISLLDSEGDFEDRQGPIIRLYQGNNAIHNGSAIFLNMDLTISLEDPSGINLMETIGHGIRYAFDNENPTLIPGNEFIYSDCDAGSVSIPVPLSLTVGKHEFHIQAWDGLNNKSSDAIYLTLLPPIYEDKLLLHKVYPIPNPFSGSTHFTMITTHFPVDIIITIYSINGLKVRTLSNEYISECETYSEDGGCFIQIIWDGRNENGHKIANGAYFYHVRAETENGQIFDDIYKLAKIE